jgi:DDE superfamily endonuclease
VNVNGNLL